MVVSDAGPSMLVSDSGAEPRKSVAPALWPSALVALPALVVLLAGYSRRHVSDDGLIYTRPVRQVLGGNGPVFNIGERAESSTGTLWQWLLVLGELVTGADVGLLAVGLGLVLTALGLAVAVDGTRRLYAGLGPWLLPAGVLLPLAVPPFWDYATSGLETGLSTLYLGGSWWLLVRCRSEVGRRLLLAAAAVMGAGPLVRPDLGLVAAVFLLALLAVGPVSWRLRAGVVLAAGAAPVAYEVFRAGYYGLLVPLPALTKESGLTDFDRGLRYLVDFVSPYWLAGPLIAVLLLLLTAVVLLARSGGWRGAGTARDIVVVAAPVACSVLMSAYVLKVGGDFMHGRMWLPPLFMLVLPVLVVPARQLSAPLVAVLVAWAVLASSPLRQPFDGGGTELVPGLGTQNIRVDAVRLTEDAHPVQAADWLARGYFAWVPGSLEVARSADRPVLAAGPDGGYELYDLRESVDAQVAIGGGYLGVTGAATDLDELVVDYLGLAYPLAAHMERTARGLPGHEKLLNAAWLFADYGRVGSALPEGVDPAAVEAARRALACGELRELQESVRAPLTPERFWDNLTGSLRRTSLRIPVDPFEAERRFCPPPA